VSRCTTSVLESSGAAAIVSARRFWQADAAKERMGWDGMGWDGLDGLDGVEWQWLERRARSGFGAYGQRCNWRQGVSASERRCVNTLESFYGGLVL
jgi:hypothetical protein